MGRTTGVTSRLLLKNKPEIAAYIETNVIDFMFVSPIKTPVCVF